MPKIRPKRVLHELHFNVAQLSKEVTGATRSYQIHLASIGDFDEGVKAVSPVAGHIDLLRTGSDILVTGSLETTIEKTCGRCLATFTTPVSIELEEEFHPTVDILTGAMLPKLPEVDETNYIDELHILDLSEVVRQEFFLDADSIRYCRPDCKGLCPHCGQDRNIDSCNCRDDAIDLRWAGLLQLQSED